MVRLVHGFSNLSDITGNTRGGLIVYDGNSFYRLIPIRNKFFLNDLWINPVPPIAGNEIYVKPKFQRYIAPEHSEMPRLYH